MHTQTYPISWNNIDSYELDIEHRTRFIPAIDLGINLNKDGIELSTDE